MASRLGRRGVLHAAAAGALAPVVCRGAEAPALEELRTELLRTGLFLISGGGANTLVRLTPRGLILVDAKREESFRPLMAQVRRVNRLADLPLRLLLLTSNEENSSGGAARCQAAGVTVMPPLPIAGQREIELGGARVLLMQAGPARGAAHAIAHFPDLKVTAVGELYAQGDPVSLLRGGSLGGWAAALDQVLRLELGLVVPAQGPPIGRTELLALRARLPP
jgi:hypothetical protein